MSFLNPVNEPVLRFKSTDAGAPQINYNARVAGDVKAVLKACLVTGYGAVTSAGWSIVNEVGSVAEFVSPSAAMSDYRLGIDDTSTAKTDWYHQYQNLKTTLTNSNPTKSFTSANKTHASNGWQLLVTERGIVFIEILQHSAVEKQSTRITYWGQAKSGLVTEKSNNIVFFNIGHNAAISFPYYFYSAATYVYVDIGDYKQAYMSPAASGALQVTDALLGLSAVDLVGAIYITSDTKNLLIGELPALLSKVVNNGADIYGVNEGLLSSRNMLTVTAGFSNSSIDLSNSRARVFMIPTDYWEY